VNLNVIKQGHAFGLDMFAFPRHTSQTLRPLDMSCFMAFKTTFKKEKKQCNDHKYILRNQRRSS